MDAEFGRGKTVVDAEQYMAMEARAVRAEKELSGVLVSMDSLAQQVLALQDRVEYLEADLEEAIKYINEED